MTPVKPCERTAEAAAASRPSKDSEAAISGGSAKGSARLAGQHTCGAGPGKLAAGEDVPEVRPCATAPKSRQLCLLFSIHYRICLHSCFHLGLDLTDILLC